jgi:hypothetical protein
MKATFYLPAHPSYFPDIDCTQEDIESALVRYDRFMGGKLFKGDAGRLIKHEYVLLRKPGKSIQVVFHSTGMGDGEDVSDEEKPLLSHNSDALQMKSFGHTLRTYGNI